MDCVASNESPLSACPPESAKGLFSPCPEDTFDFDTSHSLNGQFVGFGQQRAQEALQVALEVPAVGYNVFVLGPAGSGRQTLVGDTLRTHACGQPPPTDWCYIYNFQDPQQPRVLSLPLGEGGRLKVAMQGFVSELSKSIRAALEGDEYRSRVEAIHNEAKTEENARLQHLGEQASGQGLALLRSPQGFAFAPLKGGEPLGSEQFDSLPAEEKEKLHQTISKLSEQLAQLLHELPRLRRTMQLRIGQATRDTLRLAAGHLIDELKLAFSEHAKVLSFLDEVLNDVVESGAQLQEGPNNEDDEGDVITGSVSLQRYQVNLLVGHERNGHAPVLTCDNPTLANLVGRIDQVAHMGTLLSNFTLIKPGALHRANGGCLMMDAVKVLSEPAAWPALKRALKAGEVRIESLAQTLGWANTLQLEPEPVPLSVKIVLFGERVHYYLLQALDPEFDELFKVAADIEDEVPRTPQSSVQLVSLLAGYLKTQHLKPLDRSGAARMVEHASRLADDAKRLSTQIQPLVDLLHESNAVAHRLGRHVIDRDAVTQAIAARVRRTDRLRDVIHDALLRQSLLIDTEGSCIGQVNALAVTEAGDFKFAYPVRVTATSRLGDGDLVDIERESTLGGPIHSKGMLILAGFLGARYAQDLPLSLSASVVFEQSYGPMEGDSASLAEACALLCNLAMLPVRQDVAVTGSLNQYGAVQAVGGIHEKIEGFFDLCQSRGLSGQQGVIIPHANLSQLMLKASVVSACDQGRFHVWAVQEIDQALELLTGVPAGSPNAKGEVPVGTVNFLVAARLAQLSLLRQAWNSGPPTPTRKRSPRRRAPRSSRD